MADNVIRRDIIQLDFESDALKEITKLRKELDDLKKKLGVVDDDNFKETKDSAKKARDEIDKTTKSTGKLGTALKSVARISFKALAVGLGATATAVGALVGQSVAAYAEFEQLKGGVDTLFGPKGAKTVEEYAKLTGKSVDKVSEEFKKKIGAQEDVLKNANNAWKTSGLSANAYMETVTTFSASLIQSLKGDTTKAAKMADMALQDMADNANKMGTDMGMIQNAYSGFARGQYMMLDNLKLGYAGTKSEMERLLKDAEKISGVKYDVSSYADIVQAIHVIQENLGITGTTAKEAMFTISGSMNAFKAAWGNMLPALIKGGDSFDQCLNNLIESIIGVKNESGKLEGGLIKNLSPAIQKALGGVGRLIEELAPMIESGLPKLIDELLPPLIKAATSLLKSLIIALPSIVKGIAKEIPDILKELGLAFAEVFGLDQSKVKKFGSQLEKAGKKIAKFTPALLGLAGALIAISKIKKVGSALSGLFGKGGSGGGIGGLFDSLKKTKWGDFLGIVGKISVALIALGSLVYIGGLLAKEMRAQDMRAAEILELAGLIAAVGVVGGAVAKISSIVGAGGVASIKAAAAGIAAIAVVIAGIGAIIVAFGALSKIKGFGDLISSGGEALAGVFKAIGKCIGSLIAGIGEAITSTLPKIGKNIADFANSLSDGNWDALSEFFGALADVSKVPSAGGILGFFKGDPYNGLLKMAAILPLLGKSVNSFMSNVGDKTDFKPLSSLFNAIASIGEVPSTGGIVGLFTGDPYNGLVKMIGILPLLGSAASSFMTNIGGITNFSPLSSLFNALSNVGALPSSGGFFQLFTGDPYTGLLKMILLLPSLGTSVGQFFTNVGGITNFAPITSLFNALSSVSALPKAGGFAQFFTGDAYTGLAALILELPHLGTAIGQFFANVGGITDFSPISSLFNALSSIKALPKAGGFAQFFTGDPYIALAALIYELPPLGTAIGQFFANLGGITDFTPISTLFNTLASVKALPKAGGFAQFFTGDPYIALAALIYELPLLGTAVGQFFTNLGGNTKFTLISDLMNTLASVKDLPKSGGFAQFFTGSAYTALGQMVVLLPNLGEAVKSFFNSVKGIDDFGKITELFDVLGKLGEKVGKEGGLFDAIGELFAGSEESAIYQLGASLKTFGEQTKGFFAQVNGFNASTFDAIFTSLGSLEEKISTLENTMSTDFDSMVEIVTKACAEIVKILKKTLTDVQTLISSTNLSASGAMMMNTLIMGINSRKTAVINAVGAITNGINRKINSTISGGNWALKEFGSETRLSAYEYARGTGGHRGGNAIVNDGRGAELVQMPNGRMFIPSGRNVFLPNAPKGMKVLDAMNTARLFGKHSPTFRYANGTGDLDVFAHDKGSSLASALTKKFADFSDLSGYSLTAGKAAVSTIEKGMGAWGDKLIKEFGVAGLGDYVASAGVNQWRSTVIRALKMEGQYSEANVKRTLYQMQTESGGNPRAINLWDSNAKKGIPSKGLLQVIDPTFRAYAHPNYNKNSYDPLSNILASIRYATARYGSLARAYQGHGYSSGTGSVELPQYTPSNSIRARSVSETNTYAPVFNLTISGTGDERAMERKVKRWIRESMDEMFASMARKSPRLQEV